MHTIAERLPRIARSHFAAVTLAVVTAGTLTGCANRGMSSHTFPSSGAQTIWNVEYGEVVDVRPVAVEGEISLLGILVGIAVGSAIGSEVSDSRNAGTVGAIAGAVAGSAIEQATTAMNAQQITVDLDSGSTVAIVQDDEDQFESGERVRVLTANVATVHPAESARRRTAYSTRVSGRVYLHPAALGDDNAENRRRQRKGGDNSSH